MTFQNFMARFREVDLPIGDLARDMQDDPNFPESKSAAEIRTHLEQSGACDAALATFDNAFKYYQMEYPDCP